MENYPEVQKIYKDIQNLNIQGATNIAIATFEGMKLYLELAQVKDRDEFMKEFGEIGLALAHARANEPLARNGVTYVKYFFGQKFPESPELGVMKQALTDLCNEYLDIIEKSKSELTRKNAPYFTNFDKVLTHCHSSTAVSLIKAISKGDHNFEAVCTETRPRFQGRITAKSLVDAGVHTTLIADSAVESFVIGRGSVPIDVVFIGCDQITAKGHTINKIGSWGIAMSSYYAGKPLYVLTPLLKIDPDSFFETVKIEVREEKELWEEAPKGLHLYNPAFEIVDSNLITGYLTEFGAILPENVEKVTKEKYPWVFENEI